MDRPRQTPPSPPGGRWVARVRHDLVKRMLWPARDRRDLGGPVRPGELVADLLDDEGARIRAQELWRALRAEAPPGTPGRAALDAFERALELASAAAGRDDIDGVLALEAAFAELAQIVKESEA